MSGVNYSVARLLAGPRGGQDARRTAGGTPALLFPLQRVDQIRPTA